MQIGSVFNSAAEGKTEMRDALSLSIFTIEFDRRPVVAFACRKHSEAEEICADERVRAKLRLIISGGKPLCDDFSIPRVRLARADERAIYNEKKSDDSGVLMAYLVEIDSPR
jgi:hypothetical protein